MGIEALKNPLGRPWGRGTGCGYRIQYNTPMSPKDLLPVVLDLPSAERAALAQELLRSLHPGPTRQDEIAATLVRRATEVADGTARLADANDALDRVARRLQEPREA